MQLCFCSSSSSTTTTWVGSAVDQCESRTGFLVWSNGSSQYNNYTSEPRFCPWMTTHFECNIDAVRCPGVSPRVRVWHTSRCSLPCMCFSASALLLVARLSQTLVENEALPIWTSCLHRKAAVKRSAANLIALQQNQPTVLWSCSSAERPSRFNARSRGF